MVAFIIGSYKDYCNHYLTGHRLSCVVAPGYRLHWKLSRSFDKGRGWLFIADGEGEG